MDEERCRCGQWLISENEIDFGSCNHCLDKMVEREQRRAEWSHYHPGEPCPQSELEP